MGKLKTTAEEFAAARKHRVLYARGDEVIVHDEGSERVVTVAMSEGVKTVRFNRAALLKAPNSDLVDKAFDELLSDLGPAQARVRSLLGETRQALRVNG